MSIRDKFPGVRSAELPSLLSSALRVDHAGELGAVAIYAGQRFVTRRDPRRKALDRTLRHMAMQESVHLQAFERLLREHGVRRSRLYHLWRASGFTLGALTAAAGPRAAVACTDAVETVIDAHYAAQILALRAAGAEPELLELLEKFRLEEVEHRDSARAAGSQQAPAWLHRLIAAGCRAAIATAERI